MNADDHRRALDAHARAFFDGLWQQGDPWEIEVCDFERAKYARHVEIVADRRYGRVLEIGCGAGAFTRQLATLAETIVGLDVAVAAIDLAVQRTVDTKIEFRAANIMDVELRREPSWDLIVLSDTIYYLGWLYSFFDVAWLAHELLEATRPGGRLLFANTIGARDYLLLPWIVQTYGDLFRNVGYEIEREDVFHGRKNGVDLQTLTTIFRKPPAAAC